MPDFTHPSSSSSHSPAIHTPPGSDDRDELDFLSGDDDHERADLGHRRASDRDVLDQDPIHGGGSSSGLGGPPLSFKRRQKASLSGPARLFAAFTGGSGSAAGSNPTSGRPSLSDPPPPHARHHSRGSSSGFGFNFASAFGGLNTAPHNKDDAPQDWYVEGPGRRVGYENLTAIDWIFEYNKERQRLRALASGAGGLLGYFRHLVDASQVWVVLLLTGITVGAIAAGINIASDWLGDLKQGFCSSGPEGGRFYLNRSFCCYGYDQGSKCAGWKTWGEAFGVSSTGGQWAIGYIFFLLFSVCGIRSTHFFPC
jgi:chloride channel 3/4/5